MFKKAFFDHYAATHPWMTRAESDANAQKLWEARQQRERERAIAYAAVLPL